MQISQIERVIRHGLQSLKKSLRLYFPLPTKGHELHERNLSIHVASAFLKDGCHVYTEAWFPKNNKLDLLILDKASESQIALEAKILSDKHKAQEMTEDLARVTKFEMIKKELPFDPQKRVGVLLAATWDERFKDWWEREKNHPLHPKGETDKRWRDLGERLDNSDALCFTHVLYKAESEKEAPFTTLWALYAIIESQT